VLDFGCGPGGYVVPLAQVVGPGGRVIAVDKSPEQLALLEASIEGTPERRVIQVLRTNGELTLDAIGTGSLDGALLFDVLQHVDEWTPLFEALRRTLVPGGLLLVNPSHLSHPGRVDAGRLETTLERARFSVDRRVRNRVVHYDRLREEEILVCRAHVALSA